MHFSIASTDAPVRSLWMTPISGINPAIAHSDPSARLAQRIWKYLPLWPKTFAAALNSYLVIDGDKKIHFFLKMAIVLHKRGQIKSLHP